MATKKKAKKVVKKATPANKKLSPRKKVDPIEKENKKLLAAFPGRLTPQDFVPYQGEGRESILNRAAEKLKISLEELQTHL
jgi:hypothetical protein